MEPEVILVNSKDEKVGTMNKTEAHKKGVLHRAFSIFIFNSKGECLLQKRAKEKYHSPDLWTNACCSHPFPGETTSDAANRRLKEELGINAELKYIFSFQYKAELDNNMIENELDHVYYALTDTEPIPDPDEVSEWKYMKTEAVLNDIIKKPENYTEWFKIAFERVVKSC